MAVKDKRAKTKDLRSFNKDVQTSSNRAVIDNKVMTQQLLRAYPEDARY